jgi:hypothetical protein
MPSRVASPYNDSMSSTERRWSLGGLLLEALAGRDFTSVADCFETTATMRALVPSGEIGCQGAGEIAGKFEGWFGGAEDFEVLDGTVGEIGGRVHVSWRLRLRPTPRGDDRSHVVEQQAYLQVGDRIESIHLLCSGFQPEDRG